MLLGLLVADKYIWPGLGPVAESHANELMTGSVAVMVLATLIIGWLAMRNDWGWKK
jgi:hypothetical protein